MKISLLLQAPKGFEQERKGYFYSRAASRAVTKILSCQINYMRKAIGLAAVILVLAVLLPRLLSAVETFLLTFLDKATMVLNALSASGMHLGQ